MAWVCCCCGSLVPEPLRTEVKKVLVVVFITPSLQPETRTAKVRFEVSNTRGRLKPGMYANVEIGTSPSSALIVPVDALLDSGREQLVFVAEGDGRFTPRPVQKS